MAVLYGGGLLAHSIGMSLCNREASVVRLSVCKLLHASRYFYHTHDSIATKLAHDGPHKGLHPGCAQGQGQGQTSGDTDTFLVWRKSLLLQQTTGSPPNLHNMVPTRAGIQDVLKVKSRSKDTWYGHFCDVTKCWLYSTFWRSVSTCTHFTKHRSTLSFQ